MTAPTDALRLVPIEPTSKMLKAAFAAMNATPSGEWKRLKAENKTPREIFDAKMRPRWAAMLAAAPASPLLEGGGPTCQVCGGKIEAWTCQGCGAQFHENDAGSLVLGIPAAPTGDAK